MTKAILDVDDCAEGMRKFTTEIFDTGVDCFDGTYDFYIIVCNRTDKPDKREECRGK